PEWWEGSPRAVCLEYREPERWRLVADRGSPDQLPPAEVVTEHGTRISLATLDLGRFVSARQRTNLPEFELGLRAARLGTHAGFDQLICCEPPSNFRSTSSIAKTSSPRAMWTSCTACSPT